MPKPQNDAKPLERRKGRTRSDTRVPTTADCRQIEVLTSIGLGLHAVADDLGVSHDTLERWKKEYPEIQKALDSGRAKRRKRAYTCFFSQAFPIDEHGRPTGKGDASLMIFWMKTREKWKEPPKDVHVTGSADAPVIEFAIKEAAPKREK